ncbi:alpha/beta hydrolase [Oscillochloris sp. ZM17-4]|uniref:alpha/beta fold hydrolase n=1 Tax=Oscillochloris sp. ZM17-4 TaxID=2866714 RepID=UPI001C736B12|nr:alpha/beta fold hydrolase [Oscillochloris sp. ZM17-4]MBX0327781.1 alpha/beta hydrolase [Oscillochloris sp. ZM17-4]
METTINGVRVRYTDVGHGPAILLVHAFPLAGAMWRPQLEALQGEYRLIAPDLRGFGGSDAPPGPYTMDQQADDLAALLDHLGLARATVCGLSMGGYIALAFMRRHAARARALVLADTKAGADSDDGRAGREANARLAEAEGAAAIADKMIPGLVAPDAGQAVRDDLRAMIIANTPAGIAGALRGMALRPDSFEVLPTIAVPTLVVVGELDGLTPPAEARAISMAIPGSAVAVIPGVGHLSSMEASEAFTAALRDFLGGLHD